jgi:hypothetical protein
MARRMTKRRRNAAGARMATSTIVLATFLAAVSLPLCVVVAVGLLPAGIAFLFDRHPRRYLSMAVGVANLAGLVWPVVALLHSSLNLAGALRVLGEPRSWLVMYGAAAIGWALSEATPMVARLILDFRANEAERKLRKRAAHLVEEWGGEVGGG